MPINPLFSVIIPAHNSAAYIAKGLNSIEQQTFRNFELIVVCDACDDETERIARCYTNRVHPTSYGLDGMARNVGIEAARGEWILFMDDDDWWMHRNAFQMLADQIAKRPDDLDVIFFGFFWQHFGFKTQTANGVYVACWSKCWKRTFIGDTRFPAKPFWSDVDFHHEMMGKVTTARALFLDECLYYYNYLRPGSISWRKEKGEIE